MSEPALVGWFAGPALLRLVFGASIDVSAEVCLLTAVGSALSLGTLLLSLVAMAHDRSHTTSKGDVRFVGREQLHRRFVGPLVIGSSLNGAPPRTC